MSTKTNAEADPAIDRAVLNILVAHKGGECISDLSAALKQVTSAVQSTGRAGKVTFTMSLRPASKGAGGTLVFETKVKAHTPDAESPASIFYADDDYNLVRDDPHQQKLDLRIVSERKGQQSAEPLRKVEAV